MQAACPNPPWTALGSAWLARQQSAPKLSLCRISDQSQPGHGCNQHNKSRDRRNGEATLNPIHDGLPTTRAIMVRKNTARHNKGWAKWNSPGRAIRPVERMRVSIRAWTGFRVDRSAHGWVNNEQRNTIRRLRFSRQRNHDMEHPWENCPFSARLPL